jgi:hypothetical protein
MNAYDREENNIEEEYANGTISLAERNKNLRQLQRDYRSDAEEAARNAYESEMARW